MGPGSGGPNWRKRQESLRHSQIPAHPVSLGFPGPPEASACHKSRGFRAFTQCLPYPEPDRRLQPVLTGLPWQCTVGASGRRPPS